MKNETKKTKYRVLVKPGKKWLRFWRGPSNTTAQSNKLKTAKSFSKQPQRPIKTGSSNVTKIEKLIE